jgi:hypothetical protein
MIRWFRGIAGAGTARERLISGLKPLVEAAIALLLRIAQILNRAAGLSPAGGSTGVSPVQVIL